MAVYSALPVEQPAIDGGPVRSDAGPLGRWWLVGRYRSSRVLSVGAVDRLVRLVVCADRQVVRRQLPGVGCSECGPCAAGNRLPTAGSLQSPTRSSQSASSGPAEVCVVVGNPSSFDGWPHGIT